MGTLTWKQYHNLFGVVYENWYKTLDRPVDSESLEMPYLMATSTMVSITTQMAMVFKLEAILSYVSLMERHIVNA